MNRIAIVHHEILQYVINLGFGPNVNELVKIVGISKQKIQESLAALQEYHGVLLHPGSFNIWAIHPFSLAPSNFWVESESGGWWGNCAWCSLGIAAILEEDVRVFTRAGAEKEPIQIEIVQGSVNPGDLVVHFPIPMKRAWDNVIYTCSNMLVFQSEQQLDRWCSKHRMPKGDVQPLQKIWKFARVWYGDHLSKNWRKWTNSEARAIFKEFGLSHPVWDLPETDERF